MPNINVIERLVGANAPAQGSLAIPAFAPAGTTAAVVINQLGGTNAAVLTVATGALLSASTTATTTGVTAANFDGFAFKLRVVGKVTTGATCNVTVAIQLGSTSTVTSGNTVATTGAIAVNTASANFFLECVCLWDGVTGKIQGVINPGQVNNSLVSAAALTNAVAATTQNLLQFVPVCTFSSTTGATMTITEFVAETI